MSENQATVRYNYRLRPGEKATARLAMDWNCARYVWNQCVEVGNATRQAFKEGVSHESPTFCRVAKKLTDLRATYGWLREGSQVVQQQTVRKWAQAYQQALRKAPSGWPKFKNRKTTLPSLEYTTNGFRIKSGLLCLAGGISIPVVWSRELPSAPKSCVVTQDSDGHWNVSFVVRRDREVLPPSEEAIGIDWGVKAVATTTHSGFDLPCGNQTARHAASLRRAQRKLSRAKSGSKGRAEAKRRVARIHLRITRQRKDRAFKWSRRVVMNFGRIAIEDFRPRFLAKSTMAKKAADGAIGVTKRILLTMAESAGRTVVLVAPYFSTQTCSACGSITKTRLTLNDRTFSCEACGFSCGRDENAARTVRARAGFDPTNVDDVRPAHGFDCVLAV